jgi:hypothetical protein
MTDALNYYSEPGVMTNLDKHKAFTDWLTADPGAVYQVAQGLLVHDLWVSLYGEAHVKAHEYPQITSTMSDLLDKALELDGGSLAIPRHPRERVVACCREFATLMCALLRAKGLPARSRCGFAVYLGWNGSYEDHWICEYWNGARWVMADPQLDPFQQSTIISWALKGEQNAETISRLRSLNPRDLKPEDFLTAGQAWLLCRQGKADPEKFGIACPIRPEWGIDSLYGLWFVRGQLLRDFAALNKVETVPYLVRICKGVDWKPWRLVALKDDELAEEDLLLLDRIAELAAAVDDNLSAIREAYSGHGDLTVPDEIIAR